MIACGVVFVAGLAIGAMFGLLTARLLLAARIEPPAAAGMR